MNLPITFFSERKIPLRYVLLAGSLALIGLLIIALWFEISEGEVKTIDGAILLFFRTPGDLHHMAGPPWLAQKMLDITTLGSSTMLTLLIIGSAGFMLMKGAWRIAALIVGATLSGSLIVSLLKGWLERSRPTLVDHLVNESSMSFPSGHAANSAIVYLTIAVLFMRIEPKLGTRLFVLIAAILIVTAIGVSRVALGVHWPSDVLAGWLFGTGWACLWALIVKLPATHIHEEVAQAEATDREALAEHRSI